MNGTTLSADKVFINVGSRSRIPSGFDGVDYMTSSEILDLEEIPEHLIIAGGSYIGLEFGQIFQRFGSKVTIIEMGPGIIGREDEETSNTVKKFLEDEGIEFRVNAKCLSGTKDESGRITVKVDCTIGAPEINGSHLLLAVGRVPNTDSLNLEKAGIAMNERGYIEVDDYLETNIPGIYALAREKGETNGFMSVIVDADTDRILGATILGIGGDEIISSILNIMYADQPYTVIRDTIQPHPTVSELIPTMLEKLIDV